MNAPPWTDEEKQLLRQHYPSMGIRCAEIIKKPKDAVKNMAETLKVRREWPDGHPPKSARVRTVVMSDASRDGLPCQTTSIWNYAARVGHEAG